MLPLPTRPQILPTTIKARINANEATTATPIPPPTPTTPVPPTLRRRLDLLQPLLTIFAFQTE